LIGDGQDSTTTTTLNIEMNPTQALFMLPASSLAKIDFTIVDGFKGLLLLLLLL
jgi:hypothetical protein